MKFKQILPFAALLFSGFSAAAQRLDATFDLSRFKVTDNQNMVEVYCTVNGNSVNYKKVKNGFQAAVAVEIQMTDKAGQIKFADKLLLKSPVIADTTGFRGPFNMQQRMSLPNGTYTFTGKAKDANASFPDQQIEIPVELDFNSKEVQLSDIQLLESYEKTNENNELTKSGYKLISYVSNFYPKGFDKLKFYTEIYNAEAAVGKDKPFVVFYRVLPRLDNMETLTIGSQKVMKAAPVNVLLHELDLSTLNSGNYELIVEVRNEENKVLAAHKRFIQRSNPGAIAAAQVNNQSEEIPAAFAAITDSLKLNFYLQSLRPVSNATEVSFIETVAKTGNVAQKQKYLYHFWKKRSEANPAAAWADYKSRIDYAEGTFANKTFRGYETEMGRVYLQYGPPSKVSTERTDVNRPVMNTDTKPYQIWHYYQLGNQRNKVFVFMQKNLGNNNYDLIHSTANGEINNIAWREMTGQKFTGNGRTDRNSVKGRTYDNDGNETSGR